MRKKIHKDQVISSVEGNSFNKFLWISLILVFGLFGPSENSWAVTYYVDYVGGSDSNDGASISTPFKHSPGDASCSNNCASVTPTAGDKIIFKGGITYSGQISCNWSGSQIFTASDAAVSSDGVVSFGTSHDLSAVQPGHWLIIYNNDDAGRWVHSCGLWQIASVDSWAKTIKLMAFDGAAYPAAEMAIEVTNPIYIGTAAGFGTGNAVVDGTGISNGTAFHNAGGYPQNYIMFNGLAIQNYANGISFYAPSRPIVGISVTNSTFTTTQDGGGDLQNSAVTVGINSIRVVVKNVAIRGPFTYGIGITGGIYGGQSAIIDHCTIDGDYRNPVTTTWGIVRYTSVTNGASSSFHGGGLYIDNGNYGWMIGNWIENVIEGIACYDGTSGVNPPVGWTFANNIFVGHYPTAGDAAINGQGCKGTRIYNNSFVGGWITSIRSWLGSAGFDVENNFFSGSDPMQVDSGGQSGFYSDYNYFYSPGSWWYPYCSEGQTCHDGVQVSYATWQSHGYDIHSNPSSTFSHDPKINTSTYAQTSGSPLVNAGTALTSVSYDYAKVSRPQDSGWDIGAYEYVEKADTTPPAAPGGLTVK